MAVEQVPRASVGLRSERGPVLLAVMLSVGLVAIDSTILATAVPSIVDDLGGFAQFPWLFSAYLLAQAVSVPLYGKLADLVGRKPIMLVGVGLFLIGSVLCGAAWDMPTLIAARVVQGLGAGAVLPMSMTIIGDLYSVSERARVQGYTASVWGISAIVGPALGGLFSDYLSWRWIFFVNVPLGAIAVWVLIRRFNEQVTRRTHAIDYAGAVVLTGGASLLILGLLQGGVAWAWSSVTSLTVLGAAAALLAAFVLVERRASEPILPGWVFTRRLLVGSNLASFGVGALLIALTSYVPLFVQGVLGTSATVAGFALAAMTIGWPLAAAMAGRCYLRIGFRDTALTGSAFVVTGAALLMMLGEQSQVWHVAASCFVVGLGLGLVTSPTLVAAQSSVDWGGRGVVTATNMFARSMGSAVGIAVFGAIFNASISGRMAIEGSATVDSVPNGTLDPAIHGVFLGSGVVALAVVAAVCLVPRRVRTADR